MCDWETERDRGGGGFDVVLLEIAGNINEFVHFGLVTAATKCFAVLWVHGYKQ